MVTHLHNFFHWSPAENGGDQMIVLLELFGKELCNSTERQV